MIKEAYVKHTKGHRNSKEELAEWTIVDHDTGEILSSHKTEEEAKSHLRDMKIHGSFKWQCSSRNYMLMLQLLAFKILQLASYTSSGVTWSMHWTLLQFLFLQGLQGTSFLRTV